MISTLNIEIELLNDCTMKIASQEEFQKILVVLKRISNNEYVQN